MAEADAAVPLATPAAPVWLSSVGFQYAVDHDLDMAARREVE